MFFLIKRMLIAVLLLLGLLVVLGLAYHQFAPIFGGKPDAQSQQKMAASPNYVDQIFVNLIPTEVSTRSETSLSFWETLRSFIMPSASKNPTQPLPTVQFNSQPFTDGSFAWLGHSTVLLSLDGVMLLTDPVFYRASPVPIGGAPFPQTHPTRITDLPDLDVVLISHDHYDHLDYQAIQEIAPRVKQFMVPLGIKGHLQRWGIPDSKIREFDWYEEAVIGSVRITFTPARHFSGRGLFDRFKTLWGSWVVQAEAGTVYFSGDGGYSPSFAEIGAQYGPFDMAFLEDGAYNQDWNQIHMFPEEAVQAAIDLNARILLPIHWAKFDLAMHDWTDPIERITAEGKKRGVTVTTPRIGKVFRHDNAPSDVWWRQ